MFIRSFCLNTLKPSRLGTVKLLSSNFNYSTGIQTSVPLVYDDYNTNTLDSLTPPIVVCHGMLGSRANWTSISKQIHKTSGRRVITVDARNHGDSPHTRDMSYPSMAEDLARLVEELILGSVSLVGHSMGGRTVMYAALKKLIDIDKLVVVDISPVNQEFDVTSSNEWNMEHFFHCLKAVKFQQNTSISLARKDADTQLATRIHDAGLRAWLLMNMKQDPVTKEIGWKINIDGIHAAFLESIAVFPPVTDTFSKPTLFIGGAESDYIPVSDHEEIKESFPGAKFVYVPGAGHWVHSQKPKEVIQLLTDFL